MLAADPALVIWCPDVKQQQPIGGPPAEALPVRTVASTDCRRSRLAAMLLRTVSN